MTASPTPPAPAAPEFALFPYRPRPGQDALVRAVGSAAASGGSLLVQAATGSGKTVGALAPLLAHAIREDHRIVYLVRTHAQEVQVLNEARAISHRVAEPPLVLGLAGRAKRCLLLEGVAEVQGATAEEHGQLCADRRRATESAFASGQLLEPPAELPDGAVVDLVDLDGCAYYARVLQADTAAFADRVRARFPSPPEFDGWCAGENLCPYEMTKRLLPAARVVTAPYAFFFHPHVRRSLLRWLEVAPDRIDVVIDEAHQLPEYLRELTSVSLPLTSVRRAEREVEERGDFQLPDGPSASRFLAIVRAAIEEILQALVREEDALMPPSLLEEALLTSLGGTSHRLDTWLGALATWGENLKEERRRERRLPRSWVHAVALTLLSWPGLEEPAYAKVATRSPRPGLEAFSLDAAEPASALRACHAVVHMSGTLAPIDEYRRSLSLPEETPSVTVPSPFPPGNVRYLYDPSVTTRYETLQTNPDAVGQLADRIAHVLQCLPVKTAVFFPSFDLLDRILRAGLQSSLPPNSVREHPSVSPGDLWRAIEGFKRDPGAGAILGVAGGRISEGLDFPDQELEAVVLVGIPYPRPTARREALRRWFDARGTDGWRAAYEAPAQRAIAQAIGRMIRTEHDRGLAVILDRRAPSFAGVLPGLGPMDDLARTARSFYGNRSRWARRDPSDNPSAPSGTPAGDPQP
ncbi:MAG: ATP-dependent DNA helicase [Thermoplasmata archaeon]